VARVSETTNTNQAEQLRTSRERFRVHYRAFYNELVDILFQLDPIGVHSASADKFVPEATTMLAHLREARVADDVEQIIQQELSRWYGRRSLSNLDQERLADATIAICSAWNHFLERS
jgi:hypothetical protein